MRYIKLALLFSVYACGLCGCSNKDFEWFHPSAGETILYKTKLSPHSEHQFELKSKVPLLLYMETNASNGLMQKYGFSSRFPVRLEHRKKAEAISTVKGAGGVLFSEIDGVIPLTLKNETEETLQIVVCSEPKS